MIVRCYYIWPRFPSLSLSGSVCALNCIHWGRHYLSCMTPATTPDALYSLACELETGGARGLLLSGGCDTRGRMLNLRKLLPAIKRIKRDTDLILKLHTGLVDKELAEGIVEAEVDVASMEFVGADESVRDVFGLPFGMESYLDTFLNLSEAGMKHISPHIAVGLQFGKLLGEFNALNLIKKHFQPESIAIIVLRPTKGTPLEHVAPPTPREVGRVTAHARKLFPGKKILLGSLRPRLRGTHKGDTTGAGDRDIGEMARSGVPGHEDQRLALELAALNNGMNAIELPSPGFLKVLRQRGHRIMKIHGYGVLPRKYEEKTGYEWID